MYSLFRTNILAWEMDFSRTFLLQTVVSNPGYMKDNFYITIETFHIADRGEKENVHELDKKALKDRQVVFFMCLDSKVVFLWIYLDSKM